MYCRHCGKEVRAGARFCAECGAPIGKTAPSPAFTSRISPKVWIAVGSLAIIVLLAIAGTFGLAKWNEHRATRLFAEANQLVQQGQDAEETSYGEAFERYKAALDNAQVILRDYPATSTASRLLQDPTLGPYALQELEGTIVPEMQKKARMEGDALAVALLLARNEMDPSTQVSLLKLIGEAYLEGGARAQAMEVFLSSFTIIKTITEEAQRDNYSAALATILVDLGRLDDAEQVAESITNVYNKDHVRKRIVETLLTDGRLDEAIAVAKTITDESSQGHAFAALTDSYIKAARPADTLLDLARHPETTPFAIDRMAEKYAEAGRFDLALQLLEEINDASWRATVSENIAAVYARAGKINEALKLAETITDGQRKQAALRSIAALYGESAVPDSANQFADSIDDPWLRATTLAGIARAYIKKGQLDEARNTIGRMSDNYIRLETVGRLVQKYIETAQIGQARDIALAMMPNKLSDQFLVELIIKLLEGKHFDDAKQVTEKLFGDVKAKAFAEIATKYIDIGEFDDAEQICKQVLNDDALVVANRAGGMDDYRDVALATIAIKYAERSRFNEARAIANRIRIVNINERVNAFAAIAAGYMRKGQLDLALALGEGVQDPWCKVLCETIDRYAETRHLDSIRRIVTNLKNSDERAMALGIVAKKYADSGHVEIARELADGIGNLYAKRKALGFVALHYWKTRDREKAKAALAQARQILTAEKPRVFVADDISTVLNISPLSFAIYVADGDPYFMIQIGRRYMQMKEEIDTDARRELHDIIAANAEKKD